MAELPIYDSKGQLDIQPPRIEEAKTQRSKKIQDVGDLLIESAQEWQRVSDIMDYTKGKADLSLALTANKEDAAAETDPTKKDIYLEQAIKAKTKAMEAIKNPAVAAQASLEFDNDIKIAQLEIEGIFRQKKISQYKLNTDSIITSNEHSYNISETKEQREKLIVDTLGYIQTTNSMGGYTEKEYTDAIDRLKKWEYNRAIYNTKLYPDQTVQDVKDGLYALTEEQKYDYFKEARLIKKELADQAAQQKVIDHTKGALKAATLMLSKQLDAPKIDGMMDNEELSPELAQVFFKALQGSTEKPDEASVAESYMEMLETLAKTQPEGLEIIMKAVEAHRLGVMEDDEMTWFLAEAANFVPTLNQVPKRQNPWFVAAVDQVSYANEFWANASKSFVRWLMGGMKPSEAAREVQREAVVHRDPTLVTAEDPVEAAYRKDAINRLKARDFPVTESNIKAAVAQLKMMEKTRTINVLKMMKEPEREPKKE